MGDVLCDGCGKVNSAFNLACAGCGRPLPDTLPHDAAGAAPRAIGPGDLVGRYVVERELGRGGMGVVYAAHDAELDRRVAIKVIGGEAPGAMLRARFVREAQAMAKLAHPNVVVVHEVGTAGEWLFVAMELVDGVTLKAWLDGRPPPRQALEVLIQAGRGLAAAHAAGIVHRDFKPANVMVGDDGRARVLDFGLAAFVAANPPPADTTPLTPSASPILTQGVVGTPAYLPPEVFAGGRGDARGDQFSFCVTLHEALCGARPYALTGGELVRQPPRDLPLPARARRALLRGLSLRPEDRFPAMEPLLEELAVDPARVRRRVAIALGAAVIALGSVAVTRAAVVAPREVDPCAGADALLAGVWDGPRRDRLRAAFAATKLPYAERALAAVEDTLDRYAADWLLDHRRTCEATAVHHAQSPEALDLRMACLERRRRELDAVATTLADADARAVDRAGEVAAALVPLEACRDAAALAAVARPDAPAVRARVDELDARLASAWARLRAGRQADGLAALREVAAEADAVGDPGIRARATRMLGNAQIENELADAEPTILRGLGLAEESRQEDVRADALRDLLNLRVFQKRFEDAHTVARLAAGALRRGRAARVNEHYNLLVFEAQAFIAEGRHAAALAVLEAARALAITQARNPIFRINVETSIASVYRLQGKLAASRVMLEQALVTAVAAVGEVHPTVARLHNNIGTRCVDLGDLPCAAEHFQRSLELKEKIYGPESITLASGLVNLGGSLVAQGRLADAEPLLRRALAIAEKQRGPDDELAAAALVNLGNLARRRGHPEEAAPLHERALAIREARKAPAADVAEARYALAVALWESRRAPRALALAREARAGYAGIGGDYARTVAEIDAFLVAARK